MIGRGVLRECLLAADVERVVSVGRGGTGQVHPKLRDVVHPNLTDFGPIVSELSGFDACFFCLGISSAGISEREYRRVTYDIAVAAARVLLAANPTMTFILVSGAGADAASPTMWARVKGEAENV